MGRPELQSWPSSNAEKSSEIVVIQNSSANRGGSTPILARVVSPAFEITPLDSAPQFQAQNSLWDVGGLILSHVVAPAAHIKRTQRNIRSFSADYWVLTHRRQGASTVRTPKGEFTAPSGAPFFWSLGEEFEGNRTQVDRIQVFLSGDAFGSLAPILDALRGSALVSPMGALIGDFVLAIEKRLPSLSENDGMVLANNLAQMIAACAAPSTHRSELIREGISLGLLERTRRIIDTELGSSGLTPEALSARLGVSRSQLYRLLEPYGGVTKYIRRRRLLRIFGMLSNQKNHRPIADLAADFGFEDQSTFGRAF